MFLFTLLELASVHIALYIIDTEEALLYNSIDLFTPRNMKSVQSPLVNTFFTNIFTGGGLSCQDPESAT